MKTDKISALKKMLSNPENWPPVLPQKEEIRFTLRIPQKLINKIDKNRKKRVGNVSRNQWILDAITVYLEQI